MIAGDSKDPERPHLLVTGGVESGSTDDDNASPEQTRPGAAWDPAPENLDELKRIERQLTESIGPIAGVLMRRGMGKTRDLAALVRWLGDKIVDPADRSAFLKAVAIAVPGGASQSAAASETGSPIPPQDGERHRAGRPLTEPMIIKATEALTHRLGPIAKVLAKRAVRTGMSEADYIAALAAACTDDSDRQGFLHDVALAAKRTADDMP